MADSAIGIMEGAYFVSRGELISWVNTLLGLCYTKVEQTCTGAAHCQIMDAIFPGKIPLGKVNFNAKHDYEYIQNYKILQSIFDKCNVEKIIDVNRLILGRMQDNLEFLQWMKRFYDLHNPGGVYDGVERRRESGVKAELGLESGASAAVPSGGAPKPAYKPRAIKVTGLKPKPKGAPIGTGPKHDDPREQIQALKYTVEGLEKERDFYFAKLRDVEIMCQNYQTRDPAAPVPDNEKDLVGRILEILYATEESPEVAQQQ